jgi:hypothetical protein
MLVNKEKVEQEILSSLDLIDLYRNEIEKFSGPNGADLCRGVCPFCQHESKTFYVIADEGAFNCFRCGTSGSIIDFMMKKHQVGREEIIQVLAAVSNAEQEVVKNDNNPLIKRNEKEKVEPTSPVVPINGFYMPSELYLSPAFLSLKKNSIKLIIALLDLQERSGADEIEASYSYLVSSFRINRGSLPGAFDELLGKGFVQLAHHGGNHKHDKNRYRLSDDYLGWQSGMEPFAMRPKRVKAEPEIKPDEDERETTQLFSKPIGVGFQIIQKKLSSFFKRDRSYGHEQEANTTSGTV